MAKAPSVNFLSPVGRIVYGDCFEPNTTDANGLPLQYQPGHPKFGQPKSEFIVNLAIDKTNPEFAAWYAAVDQLARQSWPQFFNAQGQCTNPNMSLKVMDGDGTDQNGKPNNQKEGYAGCWVVKLKSAFPPKVYYKDHYAPHEEIKDPKLVRCGDYVRVGGSMSSNQNAQKPGLYMNLGQVALWGKGTEITVGPVAAEVFGQAAAAGNFVPAGMQALPSMPATTGGLPAMMPGQAQPAGLPMQSPAGTTMALPGSSLPGAMPGGASVALPGSAGVSMPTTAPQTTTYVAPNPGILTPPAGALPGLPPLQQAAAPIVMLTAKGAASGYTLEQYHAAGYTDDVLRANGLIA